MNQPSEARSQQNFADHWNEKQEKVKTWKESATVQWDQVRSVAAKAEKRGDQSVWEGLSKLLNQFYRSHSA